ncbi:Neurofibromin [Colletotrichum spinosum]|uniref:Neurofibromin n=1 Tax=Colletotrichum spinosum TaxID=1347390 RepID=A0A4R8PWU7_9PEZI|nr:Neurofibromin [Colletotrichum spinosum]
MNGDAGLVGCLIDRLATRLPHRTGTHGQELHRDDVVLITRSTLVKISTTAVAYVLESLLALLEDILRNYKGLPPPAHPPHVLLSEIYVTALAADCCTSHWDHVKSQSPRLPVAGSGPRQSPPIVLPEPLDEALVTRVFDAVKWLIEPIPEGFVLPSSTILDDAPRHADPIDRSQGGLVSLPLADVEGLESETLPTSHHADMEPSVRVIVEYVTASTWSCSFDYFRNVVYTVRTAAVVQAAPGQSAAPPDDDKAALAVLKILSFFWVDGQKLGLIIQEICSSFLHFRKSFQNTVAVVAPLLIIRWLERYPHEFVQQHTLHKRLDGGADTLFDMTQTVVDNGRKKGMLYPLQTTLLFLLPDVFEVASNLREAKSSSMAKKVGFLDGLRKALRNKNEQAAYSLVSLLRAARHFVAEDDAALVSYAMDVQDEVREAVFRRSGSNDSSLFDQDLMTAAFVSLAQLSPHSCVDSISQSYLSPSAPQGFKAAVVQGCRYFARQPDAQLYEQLYLVTGPFMRTQLHAFATLLRNGDVYGEIASRAFRFTGLVAFQKRVRNLLRRLQYPTSGILSAWEYGFERWMLLSREVSMAAVDTVDERTLTEWRNYSGFLASLGGICTANQAIILEEPAFGSLRWIDRLPSENHEEPLLGRYLKLSIQLLGCANVRIREAMREVLSSEVSATLYQSLFKALEVELEVLFTGALAPSDKAQDVEIVFAEQAISLLKALVERLESPSDLGAASSIHLGALALNFAKFLDGVNDSTNTLRVKIKPGEGQTDAGTSELKSQMFHTYFNRFLSLLNHESPESGRADHLPSMSSRDEGAPSSEFAITILSNLLSANIDVGLKHSLNIGYHDNVEIRTAFVKVLYNILIQGTEFSNLTDAALLTKDMTLVAAMSAVCPSSEVDELTVCLLTIFEHRGLSFELLQVLIKQEIEETDNESEILRRTCVATKMLSVYAKWKGQPYLKATLQKVVERLMLTSKDLDLELDPARVSSTDELQKNALQLRIVAKVFIDDICASSSNMPASFRKICNIISTAVLPRFQEAKYTAVGAFVFLRFFCPAIVAPEVEGLVTSTPSKEMRRGLLLIAKVVQNLANNVLFGAKEPYMFPLNDFLTQNIYRVTTFLREISAPPETLDSSPSPESFDFGSCVSLHRFLYDHWDHMRQRLVTQERKDYVRSPAEVSRGRSPVLEPLRNLITNLGPPPLAVTWNRPQVSTNSPPSYSRFQNFMLRNAFRSTESFVTARAVYDGGESKDSLSIICIILRHIDAENIDYDTLLYCYLKAYR